MTRFLPSLVWFFSTTISPLIFPIFLSGLSPSMAMAETPDLHAIPQAKDPWAQFNLVAEDRWDAETREGIAYMISGTLVLIGGGIGFHQAEGDIEQFAFSLSQSLGAAAIGYGAYLYWIGGRHRRFLEVVNGAPSLTPTQKSELALSYYDVEKRAASKMRWILVGTHGLISALNFYHGSQSENGDLETAFYFLGAVNLLAAFSYAF